MIEPVSSIDSHALFVSHGRCLSINADKFLSIQVGHIYLEYIIASFLESSGKLVSNIIRIKPSL
jgi:hypothetical protein